MIENDINTDIADWLEYYAEAEHALGLYLAERRLNEAAAEIRRLRTLAGEVEAPRRISAKRVHT
jgi:hypothetical protein